MLRSQTATVPRCRHYGGSSDIVRKFGSAEATGGNDFPEAAALAAWKVMNTTYQFPAPTHRGGASTESKFLPAFSSNLEKTHDFDSVHEHGFPGLKHISKYYEPTDSSQLQQSFTDRALDEEPQFNEWQYWRLPFTILKTASQSPFSCTINETGSVPCRCDLALCHCDRTSFKSLVPVNEVFSRDNNTGHWITYVLTPCCDCNKGKGHEPQSFWASGLNFCGHPRRLILRLMGNQAGKEEKKKKRTLTGGTLSEDESVVKPRVASGVRKSRAPPPPVTAYGPCTGVFETGTSDGPSPRATEQDHWKDQNESDERSRNGSLYPNYNQSSLRSDQLSLWSNLEEDDSLDEVSSCTLPDTFQTAHGGSLTGSYYSAVANISPLEDDGDDDTLRYQSDQISMDSVEVMFMPTSEIGLEEGGSSAELNHSGSLAQRPMTASFTLTRKRKVELCSVSSPVDDVQSDAVFITKDQNGGSQECLRNDMGGPPLARRYNSVTDVPTPDSNVLRKVASLTLAELQTQQAQAKAAPIKPKFLPEKLDFRLYEKFEGQMLVNWFLSSLEEGNYVKDILAPADQRYLANQFATLLLAAGVLKQIEDVDGDTVDKIFRPDLIYYWSHSESQSVACLPGKLPVVSWPPSQECSSPPRNGAKYTEAGEGGEGGMAKEDYPEPGTVPKTVSQFEGEKETSDTPPEFQQMVLGLKRSAKEALQKRTEQHELEVFSVRGETQEAIERKYAARIRQLEEECAQYKRIIEIQNMPVVKVHEDFRKPEPFLPLEKATPPPPPPPPPMLNHFSVPPPPPPPMSAFTPPPPPPMTGFAIPPPPPMSGFAPPMSPSMSGLTPLPPPSMVGPPPPPPPMCGPPPPPPPIGMIHQSGMLGQVGPPLPPSGTPSLPVPPAGGWQSRVEARKKPINPQIPMKPLYWTRIQIKTPVITQAQEDDEKKEGAEKKLWEKLEEVSVGSWDDFTSLFGRQVLEKKEPKVAKEEKVTLLRAVSVLDAKRAQNVGIFIRSNKLEDDKRVPDISKIKEAVFELDLSEVKLETLEKILEIKATDEEYTLMKEQVQSNPDMPLEKADRFLYDLNSLAQFSERILCFTFQFSFAESFGMLETKLSNFRLVCAQLMSSRDLKNVLALILTYGNYMNGGNMQRGQADGFTLDILPKLRDVKSKDNSYTFLHYIVATYVKNYDECAGTTDSKLPVPETSDIEGASSLNFESIEADISTLKGKLKNCELQADEVIQSSCAETLEPFKSKMLTFLVQAKGKMDDVQENFDEVKKTFLQTMKFFDFTPKPKKPGELPLPCDFFQPWSVFCHDFKEIWKNEQRRIFIEKRKEEEEANKQFIQAKRIGTANLQKQPKKAGGLKEKMMNRLKKQREST